MRFQHILVPTDFSEGAARAIEVAIGMAIQFDAKLTLLHVLPIPPELEMWSSEGLAAPIEHMSHAARAELDRVADGLRKRHPKVEIRIGTDSPRDEILAATKDIGADLVVMGTHGRRGLARFLLGSTAESVVRMSDVAVLTVRG